MYDSDCPSYTLRSLQRHFEAYQAAGSVLIKAKMFTNVVNPALISGPSDRRVVEILNFSELHVLTGVVGKLVGELIKVFNDGEVGQQFVNSFVIKVNIKWCPYQPNSFEGNQAKKMVDHSANLYQAAMELNLPEAEKTKVIRVFQAQMFHSIDESSQPCAEGGLTEGTGPGLAVAGVAGPHQPTH